MFALEGKAAAFLGGNAGAYAFKKVNFHAKPGESYKMNGSGSDQKFSVWIEDSTGEKAAILDIKVQYHAASSTYSSGPGTTNAIWDGIFH
jgi:hypothetical protein